VKRKIAVTATAALLAGVGIPALGQKPPPLDAAPPPAVRPQAPPRAMPTPAVPQAGLPSGKPPPLGVSPAAPPPAVATPVPAPAPAAPPPSAPPAPPPPAAAAPLPAGEPAAVTRLRSLLPPGSTLQYASAEVIDPNRGSVRLTAVTIGEGGKTITAEELTLDDLREDGVGELTARGLVGREGTEEKFTLARLQLRGITVQRPAAGQEFLPDMISADAIRLEGFAARDPDMNLSVQQIEIEEYGKDRPTRIVISGFDLGMPQNREADRVRLGRLLLRGLDVATLFRAAVQGQSAPRPAAGRQVLEMDDLQVGAGGREISSIASVRAGGESNAQGSGTGTLAIRGIRVGPAPVLDQWLRRFGYDALMLEVTMDGRYDAPSGRLEVTSFSLAGRDIGALSLSFVVDGATQQALEATDFSRMRLISAGLRYVDQSLYARFMRQHAQEMSAPEQQLREQYAAMVGGALTAPGKGGLDQIRDAVQRFIRGQAREIEITARPPQPIPFAQFQGAAPGGPAEIQQMLGLTASAR